MPPFPLLKLPSEVIGAVLDQFTLMELFDLTQCSKNALKTVKNHSPNSIRQLVVYVNVKSNPGVKLSRDTDPPAASIDQALDWRFYGKRRIGRLDFESPEIYRISGKDVEVSRNLESNRFCCRTTVTLNEVLEFVEFLCDVFNAKVTAVSIHMDFGVMEALRSFAFFRTVQEVYFLQKQVSHLHWSPLRKPELSHEEMREVLGLFDNPEWFSIYCSPGDDFVYDRPITARRLWITRGAWLTRFNLLNLNCAAAELEGCALKEADINAFLRQWMNGEETKLEYLHIRPRWPRDGKVLKIDTAKILKGLPVIPGWPKRANATNYPREWVPYGKGYDLRRQSDGMLGTVVVFGAVETADTILFVAWHDQNPNTPFNMIPQ